MHRHRSLTAHRSSLVYVLLATLFAMSAAVVHAQPSSSTVSSTPNPVSGTILTDADGWTLYTWQGDEEGDSYCYDRCAEVWPPFVISEDLAAPNGLPGVLGLMERDDGAWQVTYNDWPLYYFSGDTQPGDTTGNGATGFGAVWSVVGLGSAPIAQPAQPAPSPVPSALPAPAPAAAPAPQPTSTPVPTPMTTPSQASVTIVDFAFRPASLTVHLGDTVVWTNSGLSAHTATSDAGVWDTGRLSAGQSGSHTFTAAGTFSYHCAIHPGMRASVTVTATGATGQTAASPAANPAAASAYPDAYGASMGRYGYSTIGGNGGYAGGYGSPAMGGYGNSGAYGPMSGYGYGGGYMGGGYGYPMGFPYTPPMMYPRPPVYPPVNPISTLAAPTGLTATSTTPTTVMLSWIGSPGAISYQVHQTLTLGVQAAIAAAVSAPTTSAVVSGLSPNTTYYFHVHAVGAVGNLSSPSNIVAVRTTM